MQKTGHLISIFTRTSTVRKRDEMILNIDIAPTILELAGIEPIHGYPGKNMVPLMDNQEAGWRNEFFIEHLYDIEFIPKSEGVRTGKWKYFRYIDHPGHEELYDLENDPREISNLIDQDGSARVLDQLLRKFSAYKQ